MRIHIGKHSVEAIHESAKTLGAVDIAYALDSLEEQAALHEAAWGPAELFVEVTLTPQVNERHTQLDLLLCFRDRAAIIEMKRRDLRGQELQRVRNQLAHQHKALGRRVCAAGWDENCVVPVLFVPEAEASAIADLRIALDETQDRHFVVAGIHRDSNFLATACITALADRNVKPGPLDGHLAGVIRKSIKHELWKPSFESLSLARGALSEATTRFPQELPQDSWHLPALRSAELARGKEIIERLGVLEVVGPPGSGRSSFVRDLASILNRRRYRELRDYPIRQTTRSEDVVRMLWMDLTGEASALGADGLLARLALKSFICWVRAYDAASTAALKEVASRARASYAAAGKEAAAYWVFESVTRSLGGENAALQLRAFETGELYSILERAGEPGVPDRDLNDVTAQANGLPGLALRMWQSPSAVLTARAHSTHGVIEDQLQGIERQALPLIALAAANAPLETSAAFLSRWLDAAIPTLGLDTARATVAGLLARLQAWGIMRVDSPPGRSLELLLGGGSARRTPPAFVVWQDIGFLEHVLARAGKDWQETQLASLHEHLLAHLGKGGSLPEVTVALLLGDLGPFMSSSFRYTHWNPCLRWLQSDDGRAFNVDPEQRAMLQILGVIGQLSTLGDADHHPLQRAIDRIPSSTGTAKMLTLLRARYRTELKEGRGALDRWRNQNEREPDADIRLETLVRIASAYQLAGFPRLTFDCLFAAYDRRMDASPSTRGLVLYSVLATVNRRHVLGLRSGIGRNANKLISEASTELATLAIADENVVSLANALFYRCRGAIQSRAGSAPRESLDHLPTLVFVECVAPIRRLQALLTQASVSRHVCSNGSPDWPEYRERAMHASLCLRRAHASAGHRLSSTHLLNAASYQLEVFSCASKYIAEPLARRELPGMAEATAHMAEETLEALKVIRMLPGDELAILPAVKLLYPLAAILRECKYSEWAAGADVRLREPLEQMLVAFQGMLEEGSEERGTTTRKALQAYVDLGEGLRVLGAMRQAEAAGVLTALSSMGRCVLEGKHGSQRLEPLARQLMGLTQ